MKIYEYIFETKQDQPNVAPHSTTLGHLFSDFLQIQGSSKSSLAEYDTMDHHHCHSRCTCKMVPGIPYSRVCLGGIEFPRDVRPPPIIGPTNIAQHSSSSHFPFAFPDILFVSSITTLSDIPITSLLIEHWHQNKQRREPTAGFQQLPTEPQSICLGGFCTIHLFTVSHSLKPVCHRHNPQHSSNSPSQPSIHPRHVLHFTPSSPPNTHTRHGPSRSLYLASSARATALVGQLECTT